MADNTRVKPSIINRELLIKRYLDEEHRPGVVRTSRHLPLGMQTLSPPDVRDFVEDVGHMTNRGTRYLLPWDWEKIHYAHGTFDYVKQLLIRDRLKDRGWEQLVKALAANSLTHYNANLELRDFNEQLPKDDRFETDVIELIGDGKELSTQEWSLIRRQNLLFGEGHRARLARSLVHSWGRDVPTAAVFFEALELNNLGKYNGAPGVTPREPEPKGAMVRTITSSGEFRTRRRLPGE